MNGCWKNIEAELAKLLQNKTLQLKQKESVSGGCINEAWKVTDNTGKQWFIKTNQTSLLSMFSAEADGLNELHNSHCVRTPEVITYGSTEKLSYLILEYIDCQPHFNQKQLGEQLAKLHQCYSADKQFGWMRDNTLGRTKQSNKKHPSWGSFWQKERLVYQLCLAQKKGYPNASYEQGLVLSENLALFFSNYQTMPSLLHGDLWGGNCSGDAQSTPVIYDPAVYYGDRETDIAMTELFGGFNHDFYNTYHSHYPLDAGYKTRKLLYNLYHVLNHFNLFGGSYASQASQMTQQLLAELK